jgi:FAD/FMN-containing dehydrogenase
MTLNSQPISGGAARENAKVPLFLPPNTTTATFSTFVDRLTEVVSADNLTVINDEQHLQNETYMDRSKVHDMFHILEKDHFVSSAVVAPRSVPEVQSIMRLANEFDIPVWPFSMGRNMGYGGAAPRVTGSIGIDMGKNMNKVIEVNTDSAYALVEPGVSFFDLHEYLEKNGLREKVWADVPDLGGGSIIGNTLERGVGYTPYGDHWYERIFDIQSHTFLTKT